jgi:tRNA (Thr-GGU) A37 N-methylase
MLSGEFSVRAIGVVRNDRVDVQNTDNWAEVISTITVDESFGDKALHGLADFSHVEVLFVFDQLEERPDYREPLHPRGREDLRWSGCSRNGARAGPTASA